MAGRWWCAPDGQWIVLVPEHEVHWTPRGAGTYDVERRDGRVEQILVAHVTPMAKRMPWSDHPCRVAIPETTSRDRSARVPALSHAPAGPHAVRLTKNRDEVIAPVAVLDRAVETCRPLEVDGLKVWVDAAGGFRPWTVDGVRMGRAPIVATKALTSA